LSLPPLVLSALGRYLTGGPDIGVLASIQRLGRAIPTGIFDGAHVERSLARLFAGRGRSHDFRELAHKLFVVATDLDSGKAVAFGAPGLDEVPISTAVRASAALPGLFSPVEIAGRYYADGALKKTLHASVALKAGAKLVLCVNPLVPYDAAGAVDKSRPRRLVEGGLPVVLAQTLRTIIHSRMETGMAAYKTQFKGRDIVLFQPNRRDGDLFFTNMFSYSSRRRLAEHAYQKTREELAARRRELAPMLARHGIRIDLAAVHDPHSRLLHRSERLSGHARTTRALARTLDALEDWLRQQSVVRSSAPSRPAA
jgi:predicted acylesterase/phospholipase RssA